MKRSLIPVFLLLVSLPVFGSKDKPQNGEAVDTMDIKEVLFKQYTFHYQTTGKINLGTVVSPDIPQGLKFLDGPKASSVLHDV